MSPGPESMSGIRYYDNTSKCFLDLIRWSEQMLLCPHDSKYFVIVHYNTTQIHGHNHFRMFRYG